MHYGHAGRLTTMGTQPCIRQQLGQKRIGALRGSKAHSAAAACVPAVHQRRCCGYHAKRRGEARRVGLLAQAIRQAMGAKRFRLGGGGVLIYLEEPELSV